MPAANPEVISAVFFDMHPLVSNLFKKNALEKPTTEPLVIANVNPQGQKPSQNPQTNIKKKVFFK
jgi:hypothetical protein